MKTVIDIVDFKNISTSSHELTDEQINYYCEFVTDFLHDLAGVNLDYGEITEKLKGNGTDTLYIKKRPILEILEVKGIDFDEIEINFYKNGIKRKNGIFYKGQDIQEPFLASKTLSSDKITITYKGGYKYPNGVDRGNVPAGLKLALINLITLFIDENGESGKLKAYSRDDVSYTFKDFSERKTEIINYIKVYLWK